MEAAQPERSGALHEQNEEVLRLQAKGAAWEETLLEFNTNGGLHPEHCESLHPLAKSMKGVFNSRYEALKGQGASVLQAQREAEAGNVKGAIALLKKMKGGMGGSRLYAKEILVELYRREGKLKRARKLQRRVVEACQATYGAGNARRMAAEDRLYEMEGVAGRREAVERSLVLGKNSREMVFPLAVECARLIR